MKTATITSAGQLSVPAEIRRRWGTSRVLLDDRGDALIVRPLPDDPIAAARGSLRGPGATTDEIRAMLRAEEADAEERRYGRPG
jgi:bifunctional DNA-binding transcriptional regulator/antitoxin component of YhaV-PrlF toxin-antitoxin module